MVFRCLLRKIVESKGWKWTSNLEIILALQTVMRLYRIVVIEIGEAPDWKGDYPAYLQGYENDDV
jgi:hypothetical protein